MRFPYRLGILKQSCDFITVSFTFIHTKIFTNYVSTFKPRG